MNYTFPKDFIWGVGGSAFQTEGAMLEDGKTLNIREAACCANFSILEIMYSDVEWRKDVTNEALTYADGYIDIPNKPGLGIEIDEEASLDHPYQVHTLRHYTGALTQIRPAKSEFYF